MGERLVSLFQHMPRLFSDFNIPSSAGLRAVSSCGQQDFPLCGVFLCALQQLLKNAAELPGGTLLIGGSCVQVRRAL